MRFVVGSGFDPDDIGEVSCQIKVRISFNNHSDPNRTLFLASLAFLHSQLFFGVHFKHPLRTVGNKHVHPEDALITSGSLSLFDMRTDTFTVAGKSQTAASNKLEHAAKEKISSHSSSPSFGLPESAFMKPVLLAKSSRAASFFAP